MPHAETQKEQEYKIILAPDDYDRVFGAMCGRRQMEAVRKQRDYFDTPNLDLHAARLELRIQEDDGQYRQTIKYPLEKDKDVAEDALYRCEHSDMLDGSLPDLAKISDSQSRALFAPFEGRSFIHIFSTDVERKTIQRTQEGGVVSVEFNTGHFILAATGATFPLRCVELELKEGNSKALAVLFCEMQVMASSARIVTETNLDVGVALYRKHVLKRIAG